MTKTALLRTCIFMAAAGLATASLAEPVIGVEMLAQSEPDLTPLGLFMSADVVVKGVICLLAAASLLTWVIGLAKTLELVLLKRAARRGLVVALSATSLGDIRAQLSGRLNAVSRMIAAAKDEYNRSNGKTAHERDVKDGIKERVASHLVRIEARAGRAALSGAGLLATISSIAPFIGLFGTVWGILNAFIGISKEGSSSLSVVAPGIAEALFATAVGLGAAIPAVVIYNILARSVSGYRQTLADAAAAVERLVSRELDRGSEQASDRASLPIAAE